jgi:predicted DCC family thiol-disulfide oxidoreductase YuxK
MSGWVLFFDGECGFCSRSARLCARLDKRRRVALSPLQGEGARGLGISHHAEGGTGTLVVLRESDGRIFLRSDGLLELARALGGGWRLFRIFGLMPRRLRDGVYRWVAANRHRLGGGAATCALDDAAVRERLRP